MTTELIKTLINHLPRYAEEEGDFYCVARKDLIAALAEKIELNVAENTIGLIENLLDTLAVLDDEHLKNGAWCFVSFPAQLLALSVLTALSEKDSQFFADNFWNTQSIAHDKTNLQRAVLSAVETQRSQNHARNIAPPIRFIYVAWGIIKLGDKILFYQREDTQKRHDKKAGDYGLIGGRLNQRDMPLFATDKNRCLQLLQSPQSERISPSLPQTLKRELKEEAGLVFGEHYGFTLWRDLKPYQQLQGAGSNHALTQYAIRVFHIELTLAGYLHLQQQVKTDERLVWFSLDEITKGETGDGKIAYIKALFNDFDQDTVALNSALSQLPDSFVNHYRQQQDKYALLIPVSPDQPVKAGLLGKEKDLSLSLTAQQLHILSGLAAYSRGFDFATVTEQLVFHPHGWIEVAEGSVLQQQLLELVQVCKGTELIFENHQDRLFRLSIDPASLYFADGYFTCSMNRQDLAGTKTKLPLTLNRKSFSTAFGDSEPLSQNVSISLELAHELVKVAASSMTIDNESAIKIRDKYKKALHEHCTAMGLKGLLRQEAGLLKCALKPELL